MPDVSTETMKYIEKSPLGYGKKISADSEFYTQWKCLKNSSEIMAFQPNKTERIYIIIRRNTL